MDLQSKERNNSVRSRQHRGKGWIVACVCVSLLVELGQSRDDSTQAYRIARYALPAQSTPALVGNSDVLKRRYEQWKRSELGQVQARRPEFALRSFSVEGNGASRAKGFARLDLSMSTLEVEAAGIPQAGTLSIWFLGEDCSLPAGTPGSASEDRRLLGFASASQGALSASFQLEDVALQSWALDRIVLAPEDWDGKGKGLISGGPSLFQRLASAEAGHAAAAKQAQAAVPNLAALIAPMQLGTPLTMDLDFEALVSRGEQLFFNETFAGNGRSCGTCHPAENNLTIDPEFIAGLPADDPLFVAETNPALNHLQNGGMRFENPILMREEGLILVNADGFGDLANRFVMRGVPHLFGLGSSIKEGDGITPPDDRIGWSGDGAPFGSIGAHMATGSLRDFAIGAVIQHFPKSLNREDGSDFRLPTASELDALEAFQLSLGRDGGFNLFSLTLFDSDADQGRLLYRSTTCNSCHRNAGAGSLEGENLNLPTGIEEFLADNPDGSGEPRPVDGGFGTSPSGGFPANPIASGNGGFGNGSFNTPSLVAFADTLPAFHNNTIDSVEESIEFYASEHFQSAMGFKIEFTETEVMQVGKFLRAINAMDNVDSILMRASKALELLSPRAAGPELSQADLNVLLELALADIVDSVTVLDEVGLYPNAIHQLGTAQSRFDQAKGDIPIAHKRRLVRSGREFARRARSAIGIEF